MALTGKEMERRKSAIVQRSQRPAVTPIGLDVLIRPRFALHEISKKVICLKPGPARFLQ
jgi:hypothetical protein